MIAVSLNSGSNGNCIYVEHERTAVLLDAGISGRRTAQRLAEFGRDVRDARAVVISHDHHDHVRCAGVLARKFGLAVYMTRRTLRSAGRYALGPVPELRFFRAGEALHFGPLTVQTHPTPHDAADPVCFVVCAGGRKLGVLTDLGCVFDDLPELLAGLDAAYLESNYDPDMLWSGPYPGYLKRRIAGESGHISNVEAAELVAGACDGRLQWVALAHLSEVNNDPALAVATHLSIAGRDRPVHVATRYGAGELLRIE